MASRPVCGGAVGRLLNLVTPLHKQTKRDYLARMVDNKLEAVARAKK